jgi:uncharacterized protein (TIGR02466 family)
MLNIHPVFCSFIAVDFLELDNESLENYCKKSIRDDFKFKEFGQTQSDYLSLSEPTLAPLISVLTEKTNLIHRELGLSEFHKQKVLRMWANESNNGAIDQPHIHTKSMFSGTYYPKAEDGCGELTFMTPITSLDYVINRDYVAKRTDFTSGEICIQPKTGMLVMFPSWLMHYVRPSPTQRISIAFECGVE